MGKLGRGVALAGVVAAGYAAWIKVQQNREERDLWAEVTDSFETYPAFDRPGAEPAVDAAAAAEAEDPKPEGTPADAEPRG